MKLRSLSAALASTLFVGCALLDGRDAAPVADADGVLSWRDVRRQAQPERVPPLSYGTERHQTGELRLPPGVNGPFPVLILIPGPCWDHGGDYLRPLADALATLGVAAWTIDYRLPGDAESWTGTFLDVARASDHLRVLAQTHPLDLRRVAVAGHAGGGQLALWLATRQRIKDSDALYLRDPIPIRGVIGLAAITDLEAQRVSESGCGSAVDTLLQGAPEDALARVSPAALLPIRVPQWFVHGALDERVAADEIMAYAEHARRKGDRVTIGVTSNAGHYEPVVPESTTWLTLQQAVVAALLQ